MLASKLSPAGSALPAGVGPSPAMAQPAGAFGMAGLVQPAVLSVRIKIPLPDGRELGAYIDFDCSGCPTPQHLQSLAAAIAQQWPVEAFQPRQQGGWGNQGGGGYNGGGGYQGGGYNRGGRRY